MNESSRPTVSVLVPCHNQQRFLAETIASVEAQSLADWELIVADDGSTDGSAAIIRNSRSAIGIFSGRRGASAARNKALQRARGRYIQYLDADDVLLPNALADRVAALERTGADVAYGDVQRWEEDGGGRFTRGAVMQRAISDYASQADAALVRGFWRPPAGLLFSRRIVDAIGGWREDLMIAEDARYSMDAALAGARFVHVLGVSALYRVTTAPSLSRADPRAFMTCVLKNTDEIEAIWRARGTLSSEQRLALAETYGFLARATFREDTELFRTIMPKLRAVSGFHPASWPFIAATLLRVLGHSAALRTLELLRRPAPSWDRPR